MDTEIVTRWRGAIVVAAVLALCIQLIPARADAQDLEDWCCDGEVGDVNMDGVRDITDIAVLIDNQFLTLSPLPCWGEADLDLSYSVDISDLMLLIDAHFMSIGRDYPACPPSPASGTMLPLTGCKTEVAAATTAVTAGESCMVWEYDGQSLLTLHHVNAGLNCCLEGQAEVTVSEGLITVDETIIDGLCDCYCLFDVEMQVDNMTARRCDIVVLEAIPGNPGDPLVFTVDLVSQPTGMVCIERSGYPWGM